MPHNIHPCVRHSWATSEVFDAYSSEVNAQLFFADKVILVEGESDLRVIRYMLEKTMGSLAHRISVISAAGNQNFSPFLRMIRAWTSAQIPHLVVTDFDSLTKSTDRAIVVGAKDAGCTFTGESTFNSKIDAALDKSESEFEAVATAARGFFAGGGLNVFVFTCDMERCLITPDNKASAASVLNSLDSSGADYGKGYDINHLRRLIGSKGVPLNPMTDPKFKKPFIHRKIAETINLDSPHPDITRLLSSIDALG